MEKLTFFVWAPPYTSTSGGIIALHKLAHMLTEQGEEAILLTHETHPNWKGKTFDTTIHAKQNTSLVIYPEIITGNPYNFKNVVRWILNTPGVLGGDGVYKNTDLIFKYTDFWKVKDESKVKGNLCTYDLTLDEFVDKGNHQPGKTCYLIRKGKDKILNKHPDNAINIDDYSLKGGNKYLNEIFNECETFISYDNYTFVSVQAALAGCDVITIPDKKIKRETWIKKIPAFKYGISYGKRILNGQNKLNI